MAADAFATDDRVARVLGHDLYSAAANAAPSATSADFARALDVAAPSPSRGDFCIPRAVDVAGKDAVVKDASAESVYLCGNSLGLQPVTTRSLVNEELDVWATLGVEGHFKHPHGRPWVSIDDIVIAESAEIVGALPEEVAIMNTLTTNLHLLMVPFYRPTPTRYKILLEFRAFPSDLYALESQAKFHGLNPKDALIIIEPRPDEHTFRTEDIISIINAHGSEIALVMLGGVQYYSGQLFEIEKITTAAKKQGCAVGFDLAHAVGNVPLRLHDWEVDFACWCSYKYLNAGPGGVAGVFMHKKHHEDQSLPRFSGWWGADPSTKFDMDSKYNPIVGANSLRLSNACVLTIVPLYASLQIFAKAGIHNLRERSLKLTGYLEWLLDAVVERKFKNASQNGSSAPCMRIITPRDPNQRGCQLSILFESSDAAQRVFDALAKHGVVCDMRKPNVIRVSPTPLYNTFEDVHKFVHVLDQAL